MSGPFGPSCTLSCVHAIWPSSIWRSIANCAGCDLVALRVDDVVPHGYTMDRANVRQRKTGRPVRFELTEQTQQSLDAYLRSSGREPGQVLFPGRGGPDRSLTTRQYAPLVERWVASVGLDPRKFATHSMRRTKATRIYRRTGNLRAVQLLLAHTRIDYVPTGVCPDRSRAACQGRERHASGT
jgi:integrase